MEGIFERTEQLIGRENMSRLQASAVAIFGIGGVGSYVAEGLGRAGIGRLVLVDRDVVTPTNLNRQIEALHSTLGQPKVQAMRNRLCDINPHLIVDTWETFFLPEHSQELPPADVDFIVDAMDNVTAKIELIVRAKALSIPVISCMGTGNKLEPARFRIVDISQTSVCPLAKVMRKELKARNIEHVPVLFSDEQPIVPLGAQSAQRIPASVSFVPSVAGLMIAGEVVKRLCRFGAEET